MSDEKILTHIDLFSGIGGFTLAAEWAGFKTVIFCEKEKFCQKVLKKRFGAIAYTNNREQSRSLREEISRRENKAIPNSKFGSRDSRGSGIFRPLLIPEIRDCDGTKYRGATLLTGGFPCQPFSVAGQRRGKEDDRYLWPEMRRVINEAKPRWILAENVPGIFRMALDTVLADLEGEGYTTGTFIIPACGLNAPHRRNRIWIVANSSGREVGGQTKRTLIRTENKRRRDATNRMPSICSKKEIPFSADLGQANSHAPNSKGRMSRKQTEQKGWENSGRGNKDVANSTGDGLHNIEFKERLQEESLNRKHIGISLWNESWYEVAARFCRVDDGISDRIHRLKALGNAIVPQIAYEILKNIAWIEKQNNSL